MKLSALLMPAILIATMLSTSCNKEEETPEPTPVVTPTTTNPVVKPFTYVKGSGFSDLHLTVRDAANNVIFSNNVYFNPTVNFSINEDETYTYNVIGNSSTFSEDGTYGYSSTSGIWNTADTAPTQVSFYHGGTSEITIWKP